MGLPICTQEVKYLSVCDEILLLIELCALQGELLSQVGIHRALYWAQRQDPRVLRLVYFDTNCQSPIADKIDEAIGLMILSGAMKISSCGKLYVPEGTIAITEAERAAIAGNNPKYWQALQRAAQIFKERITEIPAT